MYPPELTAPMEAELTNNGFEALHSPEEVEKTITENDTVLVMVNSVCGCAAGNARPGVLMSLDNETTPTKMVTVFAGVDGAATQKAREFMYPYPPSSPAIALFKDGKVVHMLERHHIEGRMAELISENLKMAYNNFCG